MAASGQKFVALDRAGVHAENRGIIPSGSTQHEHRDGRAYPAGDSYLAVQQDAATILVDWPRFHDWDAQDGTFHGSVFVLDPDGRLISQVR